MWFNENIEDTLWFKAEGVGEFPPTGCCKSEIACVPTKKCVNCQCVWKEVEGRSRNNDIQEQTKQSEDVVDRIEEKHLGPASPPNETMCECHRCRDGNPVSTQVPMGSTWGNVPCGCPYTINGVSGWRKLNPGQNPCEMTNCYNCSTGQVVQRPIGTCSDMLPIWGGPIYSGSTPPNLTPPCIVNP